MKKKKPLTSEQIMASTGIEESLKRLMDTCQIQDTRPLPLTQWARKMFQESRKLGHEDSEIIKWVRTYGRKNNYSSPQISQVLRDNGIERYKRYYVGKVPITKTYKPISELRTFMSIVLQLSNMDKSEVMQADYLPQKVTESSENNLMQWVARMDECDLREYPRWIAIILAQLKRTMDLIEQKKASRSRFDKR